MVRKKQQTQLRQASVSDLLTGRVSKANGYIVISMRRYPRFVRRELRDEFISKMAPDWKLFEDWLTIKRATKDHDTAFYRSHYESRFTLSLEGIEHLRRLSTLSQTVDVYLVCQCKVGQRCHRELLILLSREWFHARVEGPYNDYHLFQKRIKQEGALSRKKAS